MKELIEQVQSTNQYIGTSILFKEEVFDYWDEGCTRYVFVNKNKTQVIKIPKDRFHGNFNELEFKIYNEASENERDLMALTLLEEGIIIQEYCTPIKWGGKKLTKEQRIFANSCRDEVGWDSDGKLICFDLDDFKKY